MRGQRRDRETHFDGTKRNTASPAEVAAKLSEIYKLCHNLIVYQREEYVQKMRGFVNEAPTACCSAMRDWTLFPRTLLFLGR